MEYTQTLNEQIQTLFFPRLPEFSDIAPNLQSFTAPTENEKNDRVC